MTTRNQKRRANVNSQPSHSDEHGVDFQEKQPIVALAAIIPHSNVGNVEESAAIVKLTANPQESSANLAGSSSANLGGSSSPTRPVPVTPATTAPVKKLKCTTSNPVLKDICALKAGELKIVSPAVSKYFGFPAGPVERLDFSDPKVADFFGISLKKPNTAVHDTVPVLHASVLESRTEIAAPVPISNLETTQNLTSTVSSTLVVPVLNKPSPAAVVAGPSVIDGNSARPNPKAAENLKTTSHSTPPVASWAGLFKDNRALTDDTKMNPNFEGVTSDDVELIDNDLEDESEEKRSLIGFFNGKFPGINAIQRIVDDWSRKCSFHVHNSGWLVFEFDEEEDCDVVMKEGPYFAFNKPLVLKKMPEYFDFSDEAYSTAPVWIQLPNLPLRAWKKSALEKICTFIGTPLHIDQVTKEKTQKSFARCLVEVDVSKDLPSLVICRLPRGKVLRQHVLYEETPTFCANCKKLGHESEDCYSKNNGKPSLYITKSKKDKVKKNVNKQGMDGGAEKGKAKAAGHVSSSAKAVSGQVCTPAAPVAAAITTGINGNNLGPVSRPIHAAGNEDARPASRQQANAPKGPNLKKNNGANAKESGFVSTNAFEPLANEKVGNWANDAETSNAMENNNKKKNNGKKK